MREWGWGVSSLAVEGSLEGEGTVGLFRAVLGCEFDSLDSMRYNQHFPPPPIPFRYFVFVVPHSLGSVAVAILEGEHSALTRCLISAVPATSRVVHSDLILYVQTGL
jgi:hypothetical protein